MKRVLTIAGSDSGGGAGIQVDLKTFTAHGCLGATVLTCLTAQNTQRVKAVLPTPASFVSAQLDAVFEGFSIHAVKIGMLYHSPIIQAVAEKLKIYQPASIILDPVMVAQTGDPLLDPKAVSNLTQSLFPLATLITPNLDEASLLLEKKISCVEQMPTAALELLKYGSQAVLLKGGHLEKEKGIDCLVIRNDSPIWLKKETLKTSNTHGTGCTYSSAIAALIAKGLSLQKAVVEAKKYLHQKIIDGMV